MTTAHMRLALGLGFVGSFAAAAVFVACSSSKQMTRALFLRHFIAASIVVTMLASVRSARACGASTGGVAGLSACSVDAHQEEVRSKWHAGATYSFTATGVRFDNVRPDEDRHGLIATLEANPYPKLALQVGAGAVLGGTMIIPGARYQVEPGALMALGASYRIVDPSGARPFVLATLGFTFSASQTKLEGGAQTRALYDAYDLRLGGVVGWNIAGMASPYLLARAFGGPVYWTYLNREVTGTDVHHFQLGAGFSVAFFRHLDFFVEVVPLGEAGVSGGIGYAF